MPADRLDLRRRLFAAAAEQSGYFTAAQAKAVGYAYPSQAHHVRVGNWIRVDRGIFRLREWVPGDHDDLARWTLWSKHRGVVSHTTALVVHDLGELESPRVHLTVPKDFRMRDSAVWLHQSELPSEDVEQRPGFRVTTPTRSLIDIAAGPTDDDQLADAIDEGLATGATTKRQLRTRAEAVDPVAALRIERALNREGPA